MSPALLPPPPAGTPGVPSHLPQGLLGGEPLRARPPDRGTQGFLALSHAHGPAASPLRWPWLRAGRSGLHSLNPRLQVSGWRLAPQPEWRHGPGDGGWFSGSEVGCWPPGLYEGERGPGRPPRDSRQGLCCLPVRRPPSARYASLHLPWAAALHLAGFLRTEGLCAQVGHQPRLPVPDCHTGESGRKATRAFPRPPS